MPPPLIGHLDADCFYVSAERRRYAHLLDAPVGVLGNQGACVIAKSYEMKKCGVGTGMPIWDAPKVCPDGIYVKRDFKWYETLSRMMLEIVRSYSPKVEYYSIDEFLFDATPPGVLTPLEYARLLQTTVLERVGVPVTVGIARTRTLAKLFSDTAKPFGCVAVLDRPAEEALLARLPVNEITGIAGRRQQRLAPWGITNCLEYANADRATIRRILTVVGEAIWWELRGESVLPLHANRPPHKTLSRGGSFGQSTSDPRVIKAWLVRNLERLIEELEFHAVRAGRVSLWIGYREGRSGFYRVGLTTPTDRFDLLLDALLFCLERCLVRGIATRMQVEADRLRTRGETQLGLFDPPAETAEKVARVKAAINEKVGRWAIRSAETLPLVEVYRDRANYKEVCDIHGKMCF